MVHPKVLTGVGYDPDRYTGFAFGMGPERIAMLNTASTTSGCSTATTCAFSSSSESTMRVSLRWLADYVDIDLPPKELAHKLTMAGLGVDSIERMGGDWEGIYVGLVTKVEPHPNADRLSIVPAQRRPTSIVSVTRNMFCIRTSLCVSRTGR